MRTNVYKEKICAVLQKAHLLSIPEIQRNVGKVDFSTIFRNLEQLCAAGAVRKVTVTKDVVLYELTDRHHRHDHFVCTDCGTIESIHVPPNIISKGSILDVVVRGTCEKCTL